MQGTRKCYVKLRLTVSFPEGTDWSRAMFLSVYPDQNRPRPSLQSRLEL